jgi:branched-chain amino acid transport system permease protein
MNEKSNSIALHKVFPNWARYFFANWERTQLVISFLLIIMVGLSPLVIRSPYLLGILVLTILYAYVGITWNIVAGFAGQLLIAHVIFLGLGAYTTIVLYDRFGISPWIGIPAAGITAGLLGLVVSLISLRYGLKADYFALFTIALLVTMRTLFLKWNFVGSALGLWLQLGNSGLKNMIFITKEPYLYIALSLLTVGVIVQYRIFCSKIGKYFLAIREDESAAAALGVNTALYKTWAVVIGAAMVGIAGGFYVMYVAFVEPPQVFDLGFDVEIALAAPIIGGLGSLVGPILGALIDKPLAELVRGYLSAQTAGSSLIIYGSFLVLSILFLPRGIAGAVHDLYRRWHKHSSDGQPEGR